MPKKISQQQLSVAIAGKNAKKKTKKQKTKTKKTKKDKDRDREERIKRNGDAILTFDITLRKYAIVFSRYLLTKICRRFTFFICCVLIDLTLLLTFRVFTL